MANKAGGRRPGAGRKFKEITNEMRSQIRTLVGFGTPHKAIAYMLGISTWLLENRCKEELAFGKDVAIAGITKGLYQQAISGSVPAAIFWLKCQAGWQETAQKTQNEFSGPGGQPIVIELKDDNLKATTTAELKEMFDLLRSRK